MEETTHILKKIEQLTEQVKTLEGLCVRLEAERDAHMEVVKQVFQYLIEKDRHEGNH